MMKSLATMSRTRETRTHTMPQSKLHEYTFAEFLRSLRRRIPPETTKLGDFERLPVRHGRRVTQEEVAEAVGVSRNWYRKLESETGVRASVRLLDRLANTIVSAHEDRRTLFVLALPEIERLW